jgi:hypothetical protein
MRKAFERGQAVKVVKLAADLQSQAEEAQVAYGAVLGTVGTYVNWTEAGGWHAVRFDSGTLLFADDELEGAP